MLNPGLFILEYWKVKYIPRISFWYLGVEVEARVLCMLGKHLTFKLYPQAFIFFSLLCIRVQMHVSHSKNVKVRMQLVGVGSFLPPCVPRDEAGSLHTESPYWP